MQANKQDLWAFYCFKPIMASLLTIYHLAVNNTRTVVLRYLIFFNHLGILHQLINFMNAGMACAIYSPHN